MFKFQAAMAAICLLGSGTAAAQDAYYWPAPAAASGVAQRGYFPMGTPIAFRTRTEVNTKQKKPGDRFYLEVAESLSYRGQVIVPVGAPAVGEVIRSERNGHFGKKGKIEVRLLYVETPHGPVRLTGQGGDRGKDHALWSIGGALLTFGWGPLLIHGTSGYIRHGTPITGYLAEPLGFVQTAPMPIIATVQPDSRALPAHFDPSVFGGQQPAHR